MLNRKGGKGDREKGTGTIQLRILWPNFETHNPPNGGLCDIGGDGGN